MKRTLLFVATNLAIVMVLGTVLSLTGLDAWLAREGIGFYGPLAFAAIFGMGGSFISLALSKWLAKRSTGAQVIDQPSGETEAWLVQTVSRHAQAAGIGMPEVAIFPSDSPNAFATGARRDHALVAVSTGLLQGMTREEVDGVLGHEISHIANGDMITLALVQGVVNTFVLFFSRVIGYYVDRVVFKNERGHGLGYFATTLFAQLVLGILASILVFWFSRRREFRADAGGAHLAGREKMIAALERLRRVSEPEPLPEQMQAFGISGGGRAFARLFATHPPLTERIERLRLGQ